MKTLIFIFILSFFHNLNSKDPSGMVKIYYEEFVKYSVNDSIFRKKPKIDIFSSKKFNKRIFQNKRFYIFLLNEFNGDSVIFIYHDSIFYQKRLTTSSESKSLDSFQFNYVFSKVIDRFIDYYKINLKINEIDYFFKIKNDLCFVLIYYDPKEKSIKVINTNKIPEFLEGD